MNNPTSTQTSSICHSCNHQGTVKDDETFLCKLLDETINKIVVECVEYEEKEQNENNLYECE